MLKAATREEFTSHVKSNRKPEDFRDVKEAQKFRETVPPIEEKDEEKKRENQCQQL